MCAQLAQPVPPGSARTGVHLHTTLPSRSQIRQIDSLQLMRAIAVMLVAWGHAGLTEGVRLPDFGIFGIDLFFVISGFILSSIVLHSKERPGWPAMRIFLVRRFIRIYPIYWIYAALAAVRHWHSGALMQHNYWPSVFLLPLVWHPRLVEFSWTLAFEMFFYCVLGALLLVTVRRAVPAMIVVFAGLVCLSGFVSFERERWALIANPILLEFVYGAVIALLFARFGRQRRLGIALLVAGSAAALWIRHAPVVAAPGMASILTGDRVLMRSLTWGLAAAAIIGGTILWSPEVRGRLGRAGVVIGNASYSAYLGSALVIEFGSRALRAVYSHGMNDGLGVVAVRQLLLVVLVVVSGWLSYQFVEWPLVRWLQRRFAEKPRAGAKSEAQVAAR